MPIDIYFESTIPPVATRTYRLPIFKTELYTEQLYIVDEEGLFYGLRLRKTPKKDGTIEERVLVQGLLKIIDKDEYLSLVDASKYVISVEAYLQMMQGLDQRTKGFLRENPHIAQRNMQEAIYEAVGMTEKEQQDSAERAAQEFTEYLRVHEKFVKLFFGQGKKQVKCIGEFNQQIYDMAREGMRAYFSLTQKMYFK